MSMRGINHFPMLNTHTQHSPVLMAERKHNKAILLSKLIAFLVIAFVHSLNLTFPLMEM
jgi:hypothetical protein